MIEYVAGLLFDDDFTRVALILKNHGPANLLGKWNAIGGKVDAGELPGHAMYREFAEETGVHIGSGDWCKFLVLHSNTETQPPWTVHFYYAADSEWLAQVRTMTDEEVSTWTLAMLTPRVAPNLKWILPMALHHRQDHVEVYDVTEREVTE